jgi:hypothetical protein
VDELRVGLLGPAARGRVDLVGKRADRDGNGDALGGEKPKFALPIKPGRLLGAIVGTIGKSHLSKALANTVKAVEARNLQERVQ